MSGFITTYHAKLTSDVGIQVDFDKDRNGFGTVRPKGLRRWFDGLHKLKTKIDDVLSG